MPSPWPALLFGTGLLLPVADPVPKLDVDKTCRSTGRTSANDQGAIDGCLTSERRARTDLEQRWAKFGQPAKRQCLQEISIGANLPSYVELLTCLELATGSFRQPTDTPAAGNAGGGNAGAGNAGASGRTRPSQRN